jgi:hypothetical protein
MSIARITLFDAFVAVIVSGCKQSSQATQLRPLPAPAPQPTTTRGPDAPAPRPATIQDATGASGQPALVAARNSAGATSRRHGVRPRRLLRQGAATERDDGQSSTAYRGRAVFPRPHRSHRRGVSRLCSSERLHSVRTSTWVQRHSEEATLAASDELYHQGTSRTVLCGAGKAAAERGRVGVRCTGYGWTNLSLGQCRCGRATLLAKVRSSVPGPGAPAGRQKHMPGRIVSRGRKSVWSARHGRQCG